MDAGRELDELIADKVMGLEYRAWKAYCAPEGWYPKGAPPCNDRDSDDDAIDADGYEGELPWYSTDIAAAWLVMENLKLLQYDVLVRWSEEPQNGRNYHRWLCWIATDAKTGYGADADSPSLAICLAALKAVGHSIPSAG